MKVLLIHPFRNDIGALESDEFMPSLAVLCLAASLRESGHQPIILDLAVKSTLEQEDPGCTRVTSEMTARTTRTRRPWI